MSTRLYAAYQRYNVFRRPDWRWERVRAICERYPTPGRASRRDDDYVKSAKNFLLRWRRIDTRADRDQLFFDYPGLFYAHEIYEKSHEDFEPKAMMEARLLARQDPGQIAEVLCTRPETVEWYEAMFFNVADRLDSRDWITKHVLLPAIMRNYGLGGVPDAGAPIVTFNNGVIARPFFDATLKLFAYFGGPHIIDFMLTGFQAGKPLHSPEAMGAWFDSNWANVIKRRSHQASLTFEVNKYNVMELFATHLQILAIEKSADNQDLKKTTIERHIEAMVNGIPFTVGDEGEAAAGRTPVGRYDTLAVELRDDDLLRVASGDEPAGLHAKMAPLGLPAPRKKDRKPEPT